MKNSALGKIPLNESINVKQAKYVVLASVVLGILFSTAQVAHDLQKEKRLVSETVHQILNTVGETAAEATFNLDKKLGQKTVNGLFAYQPIFQVSIEDGLGTIVASGERPLATASTRYLSDTLFSDSTTFSIPLRLTGEQDISVGKITVMVDAHLIAVNFLDRVWVVVLFGLLRNLLLALILTGLFYLTLTKPLVLSINAMLGTGRPGDHEVFQAPLPKGHECNRR